MLPKTISLIILFFISTHFLNSPLGAQTVSLTLNGQVLDQSGAPVPQATVSLTRPGSTFEKVIQTRETGLFQFRGLEQGDYVLTASGRAHSSATLSLRLPAAAIDEVKLTLKPDPTLTIYERIMVIGDSDLADGIPGSAHFIGSKELDRQKQGLDDIHRILRQVPGLNIQEEEGYGLRPNIGMRGSGVNRSSKITLMEDGVLIAPAPYAAPAAYYFPTAGRMRAIEVRKGSSQIKYGPRTTGGVLNFISSEIPQGLNLDSKFGFGSDAARQGHLNLGSSHGNFGWLVETYQIDTNGFKRIDGGGDTGFNIGDYMAKLRFQTSGDSKIFQQVEVKLGATKQDSDETYLGLTDDDFSINPNRRYSASQVDHFGSNHQQYQARHFITLPGAVDLTTVVYRNNFARNWFKLQSIAGTKISKIFSDPKSFNNELAIARGASSGPNTLKVRANNRQFLSQGVQSVLGLQRNAGDIQHSFEFGFRYHEDQEDRFQHEDGFQMENGRMARSSFGAPGSQSNRISDAQAWSFFLQDRIQWNRWTVIPGVRHENINLIRTDFNRVDPTRSASPTKVRSNNVTVFVPGVGINFDFSSNLQLFGGIHKGFSPPGPGSNEDTKAEDSINYEFGVGLKKEGFRTHIATFYSDYHNLLGSDTLSSGGSGSGDLFNGGKVRVVGMELSASHNLVTDIQQELSLPVQVTYTLTDGEFRNTFESDFDPWSNVLVGDKLPYLAPHQFNASIGINTRGWNVGLDTHFVSSMRTQASQGLIPLLNQTDHYWVLNLSGEYTLPWMATLFVNLQNVTNNRYIVSRRPAGVRPGLPRLVMAGIKFSLGRHR